MPIYATAEAKEFWQKCRPPSRSLAASHFISLKTSQDGSEDKKWREESCQAIKTGKSLGDKAAAYSSFGIALQASGGAIIVAKLEARLIIDSAGGILENGGICLDRTSGIPFIPGSAVKGAARHFAIHQLSEEENLETKARMLVEICRVFGYGDQEWKSGRSGEKEQPISDFWLAMVPLFDTGKEHDPKRDQAWAEVSQRAATTLMSDYGREIDPGKTLHKQLPNLAGGICFLPAFPDRDPGIDVDVLTCHHPDYYSGKKDVATDDEAPNPVIFPTVAKGATFVFPLAPNGSLARPDDLSRAQSWLMEAIQVFGLGAKTNAGYGWFSIDLEAIKKKEKEREMQVAEEEKIKQRESMTPDERVRAELGEMKPEEFADLVRKLAEQSEDLQKGICELLSGAKSEQWSDWNKPKSKKWQPRIPGIRDIAKRHGIQLP